MKYVNRVIFLMEFEIKTENWVRLKFSDESINKSGDLLIDRD